MGLCAVLVPPSPKVQAQLVGVPTEASAKVTVWVVVGAVGLKLKAAVGTTTAWLTVRLLLRVPLPPALVTVSATV